MSESHSGMSSSEEQKHCDDPNPVIGTCEKCGGSICDDMEYQSDNFGNLYHDASFDECNNATCVLCKRTFKRSKMHQDQPDDICVWCALSLGHVEV